MCSIFPIIINLNKVLSELDLIFLVPTHMLLTLQAPGCLVTVLNEIFGRNHNIHKFKIMVTHCLAAGTVAGSIAVVAIAEALNEQVSTRVLLYC